MEEHSANCQCSSYKLSSSSDNIYGLIDMKSVKCFNEQKLNTIKSAIGPEETKWTFNPEEIRCSTPKNDPEFLIYIRFSEEVKLRALNFITAVDSKFSYLGLYLNEENVAFDLTEEEPYETFTGLHFTEKGEMEIYPKINKGKPVKTISIHLKGNQTIIGLQYLGIKGFGNNNKRAIVEAEYELIPQTQSKTNSNDLKDKNYMGGY